MKSYLIPATAVVLLLVLQMFPYRKLTWQTREASPEQKEFGQRLDKVARGIRRLAKRKGQYRSARIGSLRRDRLLCADFHNRFDPEKKVNIFIVCGHPQDVTIHTPERCYKASGFKEDDEARKFPVDYGKEYGKDVAWFWTNRYKCRFRSGRPSEPAHFLELQRRRRHGWPRISPA